MLYLRRLKKIILFPIGLLSVFSMKEFINFFKIKNFMLTSIINFLNIQVVLALTFTQLEHTNGIDGEKN